MSQSNHEELRSLRRLFENGIAQIDAMLGSEGDKTSRPQKPKKETKRQQIDKYKNLILKR